MENPIIKMFDEMIYKCKVMGVDHDTLMMNTHEFDELCIKIPGQNEVLAKNAKITYRGFHIRSSDLVQKGKVYSCNYDVWIDTMRDLFNAFNRVQGE